MLKSILDIGWGTVPWPYSCKKKTKTSLFPCLTIQVPLWQQFSLHLTWGSGPFTATQTTLPVRPGLLISSAPVFPDQTPWSLQQFNHDAGTMTPRAGCLWGGTLNKGNPEVLSPHSLNSGKSGGWWLLPCLWVSLTWLGHWSWAICYAKGHHPFTGVTPSPLLIPLSLLTLQLHSELPALIVFVDTTSTVLCWQLKFRRHKKYLVFTFIFLSKFHSLESAFFLTEFCS